MDGLIKPNEILAHLNQKVKLQEEQREIFDYVVFHLKDEVYSKPPFCLTSDIELKSTKSNINKFVKHIIKTITHDGAKKYKLVALTLPTMTSEYNVIYTNDVKTVENYIISYIMRNIKVNGGFIELYDSPLLQDLVANNNDINSIITGSIDDNDNETLNEVIDESFESNRQNVQNKLYNENHNWKLFIVDHTLAERTPDNNTCLLCYDKADYVCYDCGYPLCINCVKHLKHSTNQCPKCRFQPVHYQPIEGGDRSIEEHNDGEVMKENYDYLL